MPTAADPSTLSTVIALAARNGLSEPTVRRALTLGNVEAVSRGSYPTAEAEAAIRQHVDAAKVLGHATVSRGDATAHHIAGLGDIGAMTSGKRELMDLKIARERLEYDRERGALVSAADVDESARMLVAKLRHHVMEIPKRAAARIRDESATTHTAVKGIIDEVCRQALADVASVEDIVREIIG